MKKTIFTSLFCAALAITSIASGTKNSKQETPKINSPLNRMVTTPIEYGGGGGGSGSSSNGFNEYTDNGHLDNNVTSATVINGEKVRITGTLNLNDSNTMKQNNVGPTDEDWFRITYPITVRHSFTFEAPNSSYRFSLSKYRGDKTTPQQLMIKYGSFNTTMTLEAGTYFFNFAVENTSGIIPTQYYKLKVTNNRPDEPQADILPPYSDYFKMAVWKNDIVPDNLTSNRWGDGPQQLRRINKSYTLLGVNTSDVGYVDPVFNGKYLDSVIYVWDKQVLRDLYDVFDALEGKVRNEIKLKKLEKMVLSYLADRGKFVLTCLPYTDKVFTAYFEGEEVVKTVLAIVNLITGNFQHMDCSEYDLGIELGSLKTAIWAAYIASGPQAIAIPRYSEVKYDLTIINGTWNSYTYETYKWTPHYLDAYADYALNYMYQESHIYHFQTMYTLDSNGNRTGSKEYHGSVEVFHTVNEFKNYIGRDVFSNFYVY